MCNPTGEVHHVGCTFVNIIGTRVTDTRYGSGTHELQLAARRLGEVGHLVRVAGARHGEVAAGRVLGPRARQELDDAVRGLVHQLRHALRQLRVPALSGTIDHYYLIQCTS